MPIVVGLTARRIKEKIYGETGHLDLVIGDKVLLETEHGQEDAVVCEREEHAVAAARALKTTWEKPAAAPFSAP